MESNLARLFCSSAAASKYEPASSWASASTADLTCDNNLSTNWSNWGTGDTSPWLSYTFDKAYQLGKLSVAVDKAKGEAAPKSFTVSYLAEDSATWTDATLPAVTVNGAAGAVTEADVSVLPPPRAFASTSPTPMAMTILSLKYASPKVKRHQSRSRLVTPILLI